MIAVEPVPAGGLRRTAAALLAAIAAYLILTDWIVASWSTAGAFVTIFAVAGVIAVLALSRGFEVRVAWVLIPIAAVVLLGLAQLGLGIPDYRFATWWSTLAWAATLAFVWSGLQVFSAPGLTHAFRRAVVIFGALLACEAILQLLSSDSRIYGLVKVEDHMPIGPFRNRNHYCALMELILPFAVWGGMRSWIYFAGAGIMYASVILAASRAGFAIATIEIAVLMVMGIRVGRMRVDLKTTVMALLLAAAGTVAGWSAVIGRFQSQDLFSYRREFLISTLRMIHDRHWIGFGLGSWRWVYPQYAIIDPVAMATHAHNDWLEWTSEGGIIFGLLIALIALRGGWLSMRMPWGIGVAAVFAHASVDFPFQRPPLLLAVLLVLVVMEIEHAAQTR